MAGKGPGGSPPTLGQFARNPLAAAGILAPSALFLGQSVVGPLARGTLDTVTGRRDDELLQRTEAAGSLYSDLLVEKLENARKKQQVERNMMAVQQAAPHLYNQVMAGRRLPQGSVVLGGQPRQDLMEELASYMGSLPDPDPIFQ